MEKVCKQALNTVHTLIVVAPLALHLAIKHNITLTSEVEGVL